MEHKRAEADKVIPLFGKDEMNLIEFPFGPITSTSAKTLEVEHEQWDPMLRRRVLRRLLITGSDAFGLPRPIDDQVLVGMKTLTHEARYASRKVDFSRYYLCRVLGWPADGRAYARLEESFDRIAGTTLKYKDAWWDNGEREWKSKTFHLVEEVDLCSRDRLDIARARNGRNAQQLCSFVWSDVIWKSFEDGFIRTLDMRLFRRIAAGRRREVPLRLFRILDKRFYHAPVAQFDLARLCIGTLGLCRSYSPSQMLRILERAVRWLVECEYLEKMWYRRDKNGIHVHFLKKSKSVASQTRGRPRCVALATAHAAPIAESDTLKVWLANRNEEELLSAEAAALATSFGTEFERQAVREQRADCVPLSQSRRTRQAYVHRYLAAAGEREI